MRKSSLFIAIIIFVAAILWVMSGVLSKPDTIVTATKKKENIQSVLVDKLIQQPYTDSVIINGRSQASRSVTMKAEISAQVKSIIKEKGTAVKTDDIILTLKQDDRALKVKELNQRRIQKQIEYSAALKLKKEGFNSNVRVAEALAELEAAKASLERAKLDLGNTEVKAPFDGVIDRQHVEIGDFLSLAQDMVKIVDLDPIEFEVFLSENDINGVRIGSTATVKLTDGTDLEGTVSYIAVSADEQTRTFPVEISIPNPNNALKEGVTVEITVPLETLPAHEVPSSALILNDNGDLGLRVVTEQNIIQFSPVKVLSSSGGTNWVSGLPESAAIVIQGQQFVKDGQTVKPTFKDKK